MDNINLANWAIEVHKSTEDLRKIRTGLRSLDEANSVEGQIVIGKLTDMILTRDPTCFEAKVVRAKKAVRKIFL